MRIPVLLIRIIWRRRILSPVSSPYRGFICIQHSTFFFHSGSRPEYRKVISFSEICILRLAVPSLGSFLCVFLFWRAMSGNTTLSLLSPGSVLLFDVRPYFVPICNKFILIFYIEAAMTFFLVICFPKRPWTGDIRTGPLFVISSVWLSLYFFIYVDGDSDYTSRIDGCIAHWSLMSWLESGSTS